MPTPTRPPRPRLQPGPFLISRKDRLGALALALLLLLYAALSLPPGFSDTYSARVDSLAPAKKRYPLLAKQSNLPFKKPYPYSTSATWPTEKPAALRNSHEALLKTNAAYPRQRPERNRFVHALNKADSTALEQLPGIGPVLAARIVRYREKLGGFYSKTQLREVYGISDSVYQLIAPLTNLGADSSLVRKLDLNKASAETLQAHPYLRWEKAKAIVQYRKANGPFRSVHELEKIWTFDKMLIDRLSPYLLIDSTAAEYP